jgi:hypothetical protein
MSIIITANGAGRVKIRGASFRVVTDYDALARIAAAAGEGIDGKAGLAETARFVDAVLDPRDRRRWAMSQATMTPQERIVAIAEMIALLNRRACYSDDPDTREWGWGFRKAIEEFRSGNQQAFREFAYANYLRWGAA